MSSDPAATKHEPWWKGARGEWLVIGQLVLMGLVFFGPRTLAGQPSSSLPFADVSRIVGLVLMIAGGLLLASASVRLGPGLTPLPYPKRGAALVDTGPYALVRHPMYGGGLVLALGWALFVRSYLTLGYVVALFVLLDVKSRREERWLVETYPGYFDYRRRVRRLIPFLY